MLARFAALSVLIATGRAPTHRPAAVQIHARRPASAATAATATSTLSCLSSLLRASIRLCSVINTSAFSLEIWSLLLPLSGPPTHSVL